MSGAPYEGTAVSLHPLLGEPCSSTSLVNFINDLRSIAGSSQSSSTVFEPVQKLYPDTLFHNYPSLGLSLSFSPPPSSPSLNLKTASPSELASLPLSGIDIYNHTTSPPPSTQRASSSSLGATKKKEPAYSPFPLYPIILPFPQNSFPLLPTTLGRDLLNTVGEPTRKGGGGTGMGMGIWTEWVVPLELTSEEWAQKEKGKERQGRRGGGRGGKGEKVAVMVEWASAGLGAWEKGGESGWRVLSIYRVEGKEEGKKG